MELDKKIKFVSKLRNKEVVNLFDKTNKLFVKLQLNKKSKRICWQRLVSVDKQNWIEYNNSINLKDCLYIINKISLENQKYNNDVNELKKFVG